MSVFTWKTWFWLEKPIFDIELQFFTDNDEYLKIIRMSEGDQQNFFFAFEKITHT